MCIFSFLNMPFLTEVSTLGLWVLKTTQRFLKCDRILTKFQVGFAHYIITSSFQESRERTAFVSSFSVSSDYFPFFNHFSGWVSNAGLWILNVPGCRGSRAGTSGQEADVKPCRGSGEGRWREGEMTPLTLRGKYITIGNLEYVFKKSGETVIVLVQWLSPPATH